jgi:hypothetical protein
MDTIEQAENDFIEAATKAKQLGASHESLKKIVDNVKEQELAKRDLASAVKRCHKANVTYDELHNVIDIAVGERTVQALQEEHP